jgi:hypothetical protein
LGAGRAPQLVIPPPPPAPLPTLEEAIPQTPSDFDDPMAVAAAEALFPNVNPAFIQSLAVDGEISPANVGYLYRLQANASGMNPLNVDTTSGLGDETLGESILSGALTAWPTSTTPYTGPTPTGGDVTVPAGTSCPPGYEPLPAAQQLEAGSTVEEQVQSAIAGVLTPTSYAEAPGAGGCIPVAGVVTEGTWITADDFLWVTVTPYSSPTGLVLMTRILDCNGVMHYGSTLLSGATVGSSTTFIVGLTPGYLLNATVTSQGANYLLGAIQVTLGLQFGSAAGSNPTAIFGSGYVTGITGVSYPAQPGGAPSSPPSTSALPPSGVRGTGIQTGSLSSYKVYWPSGTLAGDLAIVFVSSAYTITNPSGWTVVNTWAANDYFNAAYSKVLTSTDISTGYVTIATGGTADSVLGIITFQGATNFSANFASAYATNQSTAAPQTLSTTGTGTPAAGNVPIYWSGAYGAVNFTNTRGTTLQTINDASDGSGLLGGETLTMAGQVTNTFSWSPDSSIRLGVAILVVQL